MIGLYPLDRYPTTFDVVPWTVIAKTHGVNHVRFVIDKAIDSRKYSEELSWRRFGNITVPAVTLAGMTFSVGPQCNGCQFPYLYGDVGKCYQQFGRIEKLRMVKSKDSGYVTITMRRSFRHEYRNSKEEVWDKVAQTLRNRGKRVIVLDECEEAPLSVAKRFELYCGAEMNLGVATGPMALCHFSDAPYITFNMAPVRPEGEESYDVVKLLISQGFPPGSQFSFRTSRQLFVWEPDDYDTIMEAYQCLERASQEPVAA